MCLRPFFFLHGLDGGGIARRVGGGGGIVSNAEKHTNTLLKSMRNIIYLFIHKLSAPSLGSPRWFIFLELATVGGPFYFSKWDLTCCQGGRHFDLLWGRVINISKYEFKPVFLIKINECYAMHVISHCFS